MIYLVLSLLFIIVDKGKHSISKVLFLLLFASSIAAFFVGRQPGWDFDVQIFSIYIAVLLFVLFSSFRKYCNLSSYKFEDINRRRLIIVERVTIITILVVMIVNIFIFIKAYSLLLYGMIDVDSYKNDGGAEELFAQYVPHILISFSNLISPLGYLCFSFHFKYLIEDNIKRAVLFLVLSLVLVFSGLIALSRSAAVSYLLEYGILLIFFWPLIKHRTKKILIRVSTISFVMILTILFFLSNNRFSDFYTKESQNNAILDETETPVLFSTLDYFAQWQENGPIILKMHKPENVYWSMYNSNGLGVWIQKKIQGGVIVNSKREALFYSVLGSQMSKFHGFIARAVYDFGFVGTILFVLFLSFIIKRCKPKYGVLSSKTLFSAPLLVPIAITFFSGNWFSSLTYDLAIIFTIVVYRLLTQQKYGFDN